MKTKRIVIATLIVAVLAAFYLYMNPLLPIITGYSAKNLSSGIFVAKRTQASMEATDLNFSFIKYVRNKVDTEKKSVKSRFLWHTSTTTFVNGYGSVLVNDYTPGEIQSYHYPVTPLYPENPETIPWPMGNMIADTIHRGIDMHKINTALEQAFADTLPFKGTFGVKIVYKGQPVAEKYKDGFGPQHRFLSWSMAKSFTNALAGILVKQGVIDINEPVNIPQWENDERNSITLKNLMQMNSGLQWNEDYGNSSDVNNMLHKVGDMAKFAYDKPLEHAPGTHWKYSSGTTNIVSHIIRNTFSSHAQYLAFPREALFNKIGMRSAVFEVDASGTFVGSSYLYATLSDYARFGLLYLNDGNWMGEQILPQGWVDFTRSEAQDSEGQYGAFFWLNKQGTDYPDVPRDMYCCRGHDGQYIYIIPSKELVVVRTGFSKKGDFDLNAFLSSITNAIE